MFSSAALSRMIGLLRAEGIDGVVIGSTAVELALGRERFEGDVDLFVTSTSVLADYGTLEEIARSRGCVLGSTWLGTPNITCFVEGEEVSVDLYENLHDFYIPIEVIEDAVEYEVFGTRVRAVRPEDYVVLKAVSGRAEDLEVLRSIGELVRGRRLRLERGLLESRARLFSDAQVVLRRLSECLWPSR